MKDKYPMQPIMNGRFESNPIVDWLCTEVSSMNDIAHYCAENDIAYKYQEQLAQLVGYSVGGYGSLSYVSDESYERAENQMNIDNLATQTPEEKEVLDSIISKITQDNSLASGLSAAMRNVKNSIKGEHGGVKTEHQEEMSKLKSNPVIQLSIDEIDKFSGNEWNGEGLPPVGVECNFSGINKDYDCKVEIYHIDENKVMFLGLADGYPEKSTIRGFKNNLDLMVFYQRDGDCVFTPIESKKDREDRERLEAAYDLYLAFWSASKSSIILESFKGFSGGGNSDLKHFLAIVDKTNYRKESN
jgi:hypothetical protein